MNKWYAHLKTITRHKLLVMRHCFRIGLYWQGLTHDLSKYSPAEFLVGAKYYQGDRSPNDAERRERGTAAHGCTTRGGISTTLNIGSTIRQAGTIIWAGLRCRYSM